MFQLQKIRLMKNITILFSFIITISLSCTNDSVKTLPQVTNKTSLRKAIEISLKDIYNKPNHEIPTIASLKGEELLYLYNRKPA